MNFLNSTLIDFSLHESVVKSILVDTDAVVLIIEGIYRNGNKVIEPAKLKLTISNIRGDESGHIFACKFAENKRVSLGFAKLTELIEKYGFYIYIDLYSDLARGILLKGSVKDIEAEIFITDIEDLLLEV